MELITPDIVQKFVNRKDPWVWPIIRDGTAECNSDTNRTYSPADGISFPEDWLSSFYLNRVVSFYIEDGADSHYYNVINTDLPVLEVIYTHCETVWLRFQDADYLLPDGESLLETPQLKVHQLKPLGSAVMGQTSAQKRKPPQVYQIKVVRNKLTVSEYKERESHFEKLNRVGQLMNINRIGNTELFNYDILMTIFSGLPVKDLHQCGQVDVFWHLSVQKFSLLTQIDFGYCAWLSPHKFPQWITTITQTNWNLMISKSQKVRKIRQQIACLLLPNQDIIQRRCLSKAIGCGYYRTVGLQGTEERTKSDLREYRLTFSLHLRDKVFSSHPELLQTSSIQKQEFPPPEYTQFITPCHSPELKTYVWKMLVHYFSPCLFYIFPLMLNQSSAFDGLNFESVQTWIIFHNTDPEPIGAVLWRIHDYVGLSLSQKSVLEVLFICVWEKYRSVLNGTLLVQALETEARKRNCSMMYVEIAEEQNPIAVGFWTKHGFSYLYEDGQTQVKMQQIQFFENHCLRFFDTKQYIKKLFYSQQMTISNTM